MMKTVTATRSMMMKERDASLKVSGTRLSRMISIMNTEYTVAARSCSLTPSSIS